jgi:hypothetical protein
MAHDSVDRHWQSVRANERRYEKYAVWASITVEQQRKLHRDAWVTTRSLESLLGMVS